MGWNGRGKLIVFSKNPTVNISLPYLISCNNNDNQTDELEEVNLSKPPQLECKSVPLFQASQDVPLQPVPGAMSCNKTSF